MTERVIEKALREGYNISVEGTFRTTETPMRTLEDMREHGYETAVYIQTAPSEVSWQSTLERYQAMELLGETPRATPKEHHDLVVKLLPQNADAVFLSGKADVFKVYSREGLIFDSRVQFQEMPSVAIDQELHRNTRRLRIEAWDKINRRYGRGRLKLASELLADEWKMNRDRLSQCYTTRFVDLPIV